MSSTVGLQGFGFLYGFWVPKGILTGSLKGSKPDLEALGV